MERGEALRERGEVTWIVVVTKLNAHFFSAQGRPDLCELRFDLPNMGGRLQEREHVSDRAGRSDNPSRFGGAPLSPERSTVDESLSHYLREICHLLEKRAYEDSFQHLIIVADAKLLGELRSYLGKHSRIRVRFEVEKDLTRLTHGELQARLSQVIRERLGY